jgi:hypothetical protein
MKYLNLSKIFIFFSILASCHSTEVVLRKSKVQGITDYSQKQENNDSAYTSIKQEAQKPELSKITPLQEEVSILQNQIIRTEGAQDYTAITPNISKQQNLNNSSSNPRIQHQTTHYTPIASTQKNSAQQSNGFFGGIGRSFGVVGLVFILVGLVLFLIGGLIIDTLGAVFLAFGTVFLLIWLVLAIIQVLFDVIL